MPRIVNESSTSMCAACDIDLGTCDTVWSAEGILYCSRECGIHDYKDEARFNDVAEEVSTADIGLKKVCVWCMKTEDLHDTTAGTLCDICIKAIRSRGETVRVL